MRTIQLVRLSAIHVAVALTLLPINSTLNRIMITELGLSATLVALLVSVPYLLSPMQVWIGSLAEHRPIWGLHRTPYIIIGLILCAFGAASSPAAAFAIHDGLWWGVAQGVADILGSDHAPHTLEEKAKPYPASPSGMTGVQTLVPIMLDHVTAGRMSLERFVDMTSAGPARLFGIAGKGRIAVGYDADVTVVDLKRRETIRNSWIASRSQWTPYDGVTVTGWPVGTIIRGNRVMWDGELVANSQGEVVRFSETLAHE
jgi:dihydroorotase